MRECDPRSAPGFWVEAPLKVTPAQPPAGPIGEFLPPYISLDINTNTLEIDAICKLNFIGGGGTSDLATYTGNISCTSLTATEEINLALNCTGTFKEQTIEVDHFISTPYVATVYLSVTDNITFNDGSRISNARNFDNTLYKPSYYPIRAHNGTWRGA